MVQRMFELHHGRRPAAMALCIGRWLLPWASMLIVSGSLAYAANEALTRDLQEEAASPVVVITPVAAALRWVTIEFTDPGGTPRSMSCLASADNVSADVQHVDRADFGARVTELCAQQWRDDR